MATDIIISKKDEVYARITCERHVAKELSEYFTFMVPGHAFTPAFRNKIWDGKIRLFNISTNQLYLGLIHYIEEFCESRGYTFDYDHTRAGVEDEFSLYHTTKFTDTLNLHSRGKSITMNDHQLEALQHAMQKRRALLISPTASGKSLIIYTLYRQLHDFQKLKGLIVVPNIQLVEQLYSDFADYSSHNGFDVDSNVHRIYQGKDKTSEKNLIISTWQSIYTQPKEYFEQFDYVIGDEAHLFKSQSLTTILTSCINAKYRVGLTGTLDGTKTNKLVLEGLFGPVRKVITTKELMDKNIIAKFEIKCLVLSHPLEICKEYKSATYQEEMQYLISNEQRNKFIKNLAVSLKTNTLILFNLVDKHGKVLYDMIRNTEKIGERKVFFVSGNTDVEDRENIRVIMESETDAIVVASFGTMSTGTNIRNLHNIIFASPSKGRVRNLQSIGRSLRKSEGKTIATLFDISDDMRHGKQMNYTLKHFVERIKLYNEEKFTYKIYKISLGNKNG